MALNEYDELLTGGKVRANEYDAIVEDTKRNDEAALRQSMTVAAQTTPDQRAKVIELSRKTKLPVEMVDRNYDLISKRMDVGGNEYDRMITQSPKLAEFLKDANNAAATRDDLSNLGALEWIVTAPQRAWKRGRAQVEFGDLRSQSLFRDLTAAEHARLADLRKEMEAGGDLGAESWFGKALTGGAQQLPMLFGGLLAGARTGLPSSMGAASAAFVAGQMGPQIAMPEEVATVPAAALMGYYAGQTAGSARFGFQQEAGHAYEEFSKFKDELGRPIDDSVAKAAAIAAGSINAGLEAFQLNTLMRSIPGADKLAGAATRSAISKALAAPTVREALKTLMLGYSKTLSIETATEVAQRAVTIMSGELGKAASGQNIKGRDAADISRDLVNEGIQAAQAFTFLSLPGPVMRGYSDSLRIREAKKNEAFFTALGEGVTQSKTFERLPDTLQDFIARATKDGPIENVYVSPEAITQYAQSINADPIELANAMLGDTAAFEEAVRTGNDIAVPMSRYATKIAPTEANAFFAQEIRLAPDEMNAREAKELEATIAAEAEASAKPADQTVEDSSSKVREDITGQLLGQGYDRGTVDAYAASVEAAFRTMGQRAGIDPYQLFQRYGLKINRPMPGVLTDRKNIDALDSLLDRLRAGDVPTDADIFGPSLTEFLRGKGGIMDEGGELRGRDPDVGLKPFQKKLINEQGMSLDDALTAAREAGYFNEADANSVDTMDINSLLDAIDEDLRGNPLYSMRRQDSAKLEMATTLNQLGEYLQQRGINLNEMSNEEIKRILNEAAQDQSRQSGDVEFAQAMQRGTINVDGVERPVVNSNGQPIAGSTEALQAFWSWFGDSKVVDAQGRPLVVYHGTGVNSGRRGEFMSGDFDTFDPELSGKSSKTGAPAGTFFFTDDPAVASSYTVKWRGDFSENLKDNANVMPVYLSIQSPLKVNAKGENWREILYKGETRDVNEIAAIAKNDGKRDGAIITRVVDHGVGGTSEKPSNTFVAFKPEQIKSATGNRGTFDPMSGNILYQPAYHGSPHDFTKFSTDKIGTGEGAQAYGWGLYFAENPSVATGYHRNLAGNPEIKNFKVGRFNIVRNGNFIDYGPRDNTDIENVKASIIENLLVHEHDLRSAHAIGKLRDYVMSEIEHYVTDYYDKERDQKLIAAAKQFKASVERWGISFELGETSGGVYQVDIPDAAVAKMLDWDKPLSEQAHIMQALAKSRNKAVKDTLAAIGDVSVPIDSYGTDLGLRTGESLYRLLSLNLDGKSGESKKASMALRAAGVPGIKYFDQQSRGRTGGEIVFVKQNDAGMWESRVKVERGGDQMFTTSKPYSTEQEARSWAENAIAKGTRNIVVFDESIITLTHKDGKPVTAAERKEFLQHDSEMSDKRGAIRFGGDRQFNIDLLAKADLSTFLHETGHFYLEVIGDVVAELGAKDAATLNDTQRQMLKDYAAVLKWLGVDSREKIGVDQHEQWARGIEAYMREGKSPSVELRSVFARFRSWLINIYRSLAKLNVELTPEVRAVMDRVFATDEEITAAEKEAEILPMFTDAASAGMTDAEFAAYKSTVQSASDMARDKLNAKLMAQLQREREKWWKDERENVRKEIAAEVYQRREYIALSVLQSGKLPDWQESPVGEVKLDRAALVETYGKDFLKRLPRPYVYSVKDGLHPDRVAEMFGYKSGDELVNDLANARNMKALIEAEADQRMREQHGDMLLDGSIVDAARAAVQNEERSKVIHAELRALRKKHREVAPFLKAERDAVAARQREGVASIQGIPPIAVFTRMAQGRVAQMLARDLKPIQFLMAARRSGRKAIEAAAKQDYEAATVEKQRELMNVELYRAATNAREEVDGIVDYMRSFGDAKKRARLGKAGQDYLDQIDGLLDRFSFARIPLKILERRKALTQWVAEKEKQGIPVNLPDELIAESARVNYKDMTVEEMTGLRDAVKHIEHLARLKNRLLKSQAKRELDAAASEIEQSLLDNGKVRESKIETRLPTDDAARLVNGWFASHRKLSSFARQMDGFKDGGAMWEYIIRPINEAADTEAAMNAEASVRLQELFSAYKGKEISALYAKTDIPAIGTSLTKMGRLMVALNWGNAGNRQRIMDGYKWNESQVQAILDTLDERDWKFVQGVWDFVDSYWSQIKAKEERVNGIAPEKVDAVPVTTRFGEIRGGYFPIKYDDRQSARAGAHLESEFADIAKAASYVRASTRRGHTEARVDKVEMPVRLDFGVIFEHTSQVIHDLSHHEMLLDTGRLLGHKAVQDAIYATHGEIVYKEFKAAMLDIAFGETPAITPFEKSINWIRQGATIAGLGWNVTTSLLQPFGIAQSMVRVGPQWIGKGLSRWMRDAAGFENSARWIQDRSPFMANRMKTQLREINEIRNNVGLNTGKLGGWVDEALRTTTFDHVTKQGVVDSFFWLIHKGQQIADIPTWLGAYEKARAEGNDEARSVALADQAVLDSQGGGQAKDLASIQRGGPLLKLWTNFYSYFNVTYNLSVESARRTDFRDPVSIGRFAVDMLLLYTLPATLAALMKHALTGGDEDEEKLREKLVRENISYMMGVMIGLRELGSVAQGFQGYEGPAGTRFFSALGKLVKQSEQGDLDAAFWKSLNDTAGVLLHYPSGAVRRATEGAAAMWEGEARNPLVLLVGPPKQAK